MNFVRSVTSGCQWSWGAHCWCSCSENYKKVCYKLSGKWLSISQFVGFYRNYVGSVCWCDLRLCISCLRDLHVINVITSLNRHDPGCLDFFKNFGCLKLYEHWHSLSFEHAQHPLPLHLFKTRPLGGYTMNCGHLGWLLSKCCQTMSPTRTSLALTSVSPNGLILKRGRGNGCSACSNDNGHIGTIVGAGDVLVRHSNPHYHNSQVTSLPYLECISPVITCSLAK